MGDHSKIEWTDASWNAIRARNKATGKVGWHCEHASPGCVHCYSESFNRDRLGTRLAFKPGHRDDVEIFLDEAMLLQPLRWRRPRKIFVCSMTDLFGEFVPDAMIDRVFAVMALAPQHTFLVLTKRSARLREYMTRLVQGPWAGRAFRDGKPETDAAWRIRTAVTDMLKDCPPDALNRAIEFMDKCDGSDLVTGSSAAGPSPTSGSASRPRISAGPTSACRTCSRPRRPFGSCRPSRCSGRLTFDMSASALKTL